MEIEINNDEKIQLSQDSYSMINKDQLQKAIDGYSNSVKNFAKYEFNEAGKALVKAGPTLNK